MEKNLGGRPRLGKNKLVGRTIFFAPRELKRIEEKAQRYNMSVSAFVRSIMLRELL